MQLQIIEGTWEEVKLREEELMGRHVRVIIQPKDLALSGSIVQAQRKEPRGQMIRWGMFPELASITDDDIRSAEFHGDSDDGLDWEPGQSSVTVELEGTVVTRLSAPNTIQKRLDALNAWFALPRTTLSHEIDDSRAGIYGEGEDRP